MSELVCKADPMTPETPQRIDRNRQCGWGVKKADHVLEGPDWQAAMRHATRLGWELWRMALSKLSKEIRERTRESRPLVDPSNSTGRKLL